MDEFAAPAIAGYAVDSISAQRFAKFGDDGTVVVGNLLEPAERGFDGQSSISQGQSLSGRKANTLRYEKQTYLKLPRLSHYLIAIYKYASMNKSLMHTLIHKKGKL
ncbi:MAG: hypothetical protein AB7I51_16805 [Methylocystis sp.]